MIDDDFWRIGGMKSGRGNQSTRRKPTPAPLCAPQNPAWQTRSRTPDRSGAKSVANRLSYGAAFFSPFRRLLRLAGSRWRYSTPPPHGLTSNFTVPGMLTTPNEMKNIHEVRKCCYDNSSISYLCTIRIFRSSLKMICRIWRNSKCTAIVSYFLYIFLQVKWQELRDALLLGAWYPVSIVD
jgi:hypothetical protein